jgi:hypothetical protein
MKKKLIVSVTLWVELEVEDQENISGVVDKLHAQAGHMLPAMGFRPHREPQVVITREAKK